MATLLFSGTTVAKSPVEWVEISAGPQSGYSWDSVALYLHNASAGIATVKVRKFMTFGVEIFDAAIAAGEGAELLSFRLESGQSVEIETDVDLGFTAYGYIVGVIRHPNHDKTFNCLSGNYQGVIGYKLEITGETLSKTVQLPSMELGWDFSISGQVREPVIFDASDLVGGWDLTLKADFTVNPHKKNWVAWGKVGEASFKADLTNDAGTMPMSWSGWVLAVKQLGKNVVVYGSNGVTIMVSVPEPFPTFGRQDILNVGLKSKTSVAGDDKVHYFVDSDSRLWVLTEQGPQKLGYEEFLSTIAIPVLSYNPLNGYLLISGLGVGYMLTNKGLGGGYLSTTGLVVVDMEPLIISPTSPTIQEFHIATEVIDFGYRGLKTLEGIQLGVDTEAALYTAIEYKYSKLDTAFKMTPWILVNPEGFSYHKITALEFRVHVKQLVREFCQIDYINIQYKRSDRRFVRGALGAEHDPSTSA